ncbi:MAG: hypothetical protein M1839_008128 [Geoglossum umbratile]|nr:MAG: hypothetical protein M1839_008128 [Geoglossum umbratile]
MASSHEYLTNDVLLRAVVARLEDKHSFVRQAAVKALRSRSSLSEEILQAMVALLESRHWYVRQAVEALQSSLSEEILQVVVARLEDEYTLVIQAAVKALGSQSSLFDEIFKAIAVLLESKKASELAEAILRKHEEFYSTLLNGPFAKSLYQVLLRRSFEEHWSWYSNGKQVRAILCSDYARKARSIPTLTFTSTSQIATSMHPSWTCF